MSSLASSVAISETQQPKQHQLSYGSVCSGIEAATVAWSRLGWSSAWLAEIEPFPSAVLAYHYPTVPNLGDMTRIRDRVASGDVYAPDILVGGTPCQAFSVAGARNSLDDDRGQLTLEYVRLADEIDTARSIRGEQPSIIVWENVPGVLSTKDNAFGCFLGALSGEDCELQPTGKKWTNAGCVFGPKRAVAWRVLDAQYFGLAQRRKRVFVVASARKDFHPDKVLFEFDGLRRDTPPSRSERQETARSTGSCTKSSGATISGKDIFPTLAASMGSKLWLGNQEAFSGDYFVCHGTQDPLVQRDTAFPLGRNSWQENAVYCGTQNDACRDVGREVAPTLRAGNGGGAVNQVVNVTYSLQGNFVDRETKQNGSGVSLECAHTLNTQDKHAVAFGIQGNMIGRNDNAGPQGSGVSEDVSFTLTKGDRHGVAFAFAENSRSEVRLEGGDGQRTGTLSTGGGKPGQGMPTIVTHGLVRRLIPKECERLQGFPDEYTKIPYRNKAAEECPDGARYAALGNSMAVAVMEWIGKRIQAHLNGEHC